MEQSGRPVPREEFQQKLWPSDTFVDFDHGLNTAVAKLREALGDSASNPRFVETLARRGYRFLAPVQWSGSATGTLASPKVEAGIHPELDVPAPNRGVARALFVLLQIMYLAFYLAALLRLHAVDEIASRFLPEWISFPVVAVALVTAGVGIPLRCYLLSATAFDYQRLGEKFLRLFPLVMLLDELWAVSPFLLTGKIGFGLAFASTAALLYVPFSERTLIRMAYLRSPI